MFDVGEYLVYKNNVCKVKDIKDKEGIMYYKLVPIDDDSLKIEIPVENSDGILRKVISRKEVESLVKEIPKIEVIEIPDRLIEYEYKNLISTGDKIDLIKVIKTAYLRNKKRLENKKRLNEKDVNYLEKAEKILYNELCIALNLTFEQVKEYIINKVEMLVG